MKQAFKNPFLLIPAFIFLAALVWQASEILRGWDHNILAHHGFRQTQTAISAYYFLKEGFSLYTVIPVFGPPWILTYEFPLYQWILAGTVKLTGLPLDPTGRAISLFFHFLSLILTYRILRFFKTSPAGSLFILTVITLSPLGTYWAQGVLIESLSVSLTLAYILVIIRAIESRNKPVLFAGILLGALSSVVKVTTFAVGWGFLVLYGFYWLWQHREQAPPRFSRISIFWLIPLALPLIVAGAWMIHTGTIAASLPLAPDSSSHLEWFFGMPWARLDPREWVQVFKHTILYTLGSPLPLIIAMIPLCQSGASRLKISLFFCTAISGPLVFWNVYFIHDYYAYEILFFLCIAIGLCFEEGLKVASGWMQPVLRCLQILLLLSMLGGYYFTPYAWLLRNDHKADQKHFLEEVSGLVEEDAFLLTAGTDWDPTVAYTTERKVLTIRWNGWIHTDFFMKVYQDMLNDGYKCGGIIINNENVSVAERQEIINKFQMKQSPALSLDESLQFHRKN